MIKAFPQNNMLGFQHFRIAALKDCRIAALKNCSIV